MWSEEDDDKEPSIRQKRYGYNKKKVFFFVAYSAGFVAHAAELLWCLGAYRVGLKGDEAGGTAEVFYSSFSVHCSHDEVQRL